MSKLAAFAAVVAALGLPAGLAQGRGTAPSTSSCPTVTAGKLTVGTDNPAYPPWFQGNPAKGSSWKVSDPRSGKGYESAVAYAVAAKLGFSKANVLFNYQPGDYLRWGKGTWPANRWTCVQWQFDGSKDEARVWLARSQPSEPEYAEARRALEKLAPAGR